MRKLIFPALVMAFALGLAGSLGAQQTARPIVLLFETVKGEGADRELAAEVTKALRTYFRETRRVDVIVFDRESAQAKQAVADGTLTADQVTSYATTSDRVVVAKSLGYPYAASGEISIRDATIEVRLWLSEVGRQDGSWQTSGFARTSGAQVFDVRNSMQSAASAAVIAMDRKALSGLPQSAVQDDPSAYSTAALTPPSTTPTAAVAAATHAVSARQNVAAGNLAQAIEDYSRAISAEPTNVSVRLELAETYARKGMIEAANAEVGRAIMIGASEEDVARTRKRISDIEQGRSVAPAVPPPPAVEAVIRMAPEPLPESETGDGETSEVEPQDRKRAAVLKMVEGDTLWSRGQPDEAAQRYRESIKLNPDDWRAHERLAVVNASIALFDESRKAIRQLNVVQPEPDARVISNRYDMFRKAFDKHFALMLRQYAKDATAFAKQEMSRESYYTAVKGMAERLETMTQFLDTITVPRAKQPINLRRSLACGLMAQAASSLLEYLETNGESAKEDADTFVLQAGKEIETAAKMEAAPVEPAPDTAEEAPAAPATVIQPAPTGDSS